MSHIKEIYAEKEMVIKVVDEEEGLEADMNDIPGRRKYVHICKIFVILFIIIIYNLFSVCVSLVSD